jgi:hypothetical protein
MPALALRSKFTETRLLAFMFRDPDARQLVLCLTIALRTPLWEQQFFQTQSGQIGPITPLTKYLLEHSNELLVFLGSHHCLLP